jgi:hypothetical protein
MPLLEREIAQASPKLSLRLMGVRLSSLRDTRKVSAHQKGIDAFLVHGVKPSLQASSSVQESGYANESRAKDEAKDEENDDCCIVEAQPARPYSTLDVTCPVCCTRLTSDNFATNRHIDECLNRDVLGCLGGSSRESTPKRAKGLDGFVVFGRRK